MVAATVLRSLAARPTAPPAETLGHARPSRFSQPPRGTVSVNVRLREVVPALQRARRGDDGTPRRINRVTLLRSTWCARPPTATHAPRSRWPRPAPPGHSSRQTFVLFRGVSDLVATLLLGPLVCSSNGAAPNARVLTVTVVWRGARCSTPFSSRTQSHEAPRIAGSDDVFCKPPASALSASERPQ